MSTSTKMAAWTALRRKLTLAFSILLTAGLSVLVPAPPAALAASPGASSISAGDAHACAIQGGRAYCWGNGGALGDSSYDSSSVPVAVDIGGVLAGKTLTQISAGGSQTCALVSSGAAYCWGFNNYGPLGDGSTSPSNVPVAVDTGGVLAGKTLTQVAAGELDTCAVDGTGEAYCWGANQAGQLGDGSTSQDSTVPVAVDTGGVLAGKTLTQITANLVLTCALDSNGAAYCWGQGGSGELGDGSTTDSNVPVAVKTSGVLAGKTLTQITAGDDHACAMDSTGRAYCWGYNGYGQLGDGSPSKYSDVPVAVDTSGVLAGKTLTQITAGWEHTCALDSTGAAYCWGWNSDGDLGDDSAMDSDVPVAVDASGALAGKTLSEITAYGYLTCADDASGSAYCWGDNLDGDLGDDSTTPSDVPVLVGRDAPTGVTAVPGDTTATVSWKAPASLNGGTLTGYTATAVPGGAACTTVGATTCTITGLTNGTTYSITVVAYATAGNSGASSPATVIPEPRGARPIVSGYRMTACIDDSNGSSVNDTPIVMWDCNGSAQQNWTPEADGTIRINGKCMDIYRDEKKTKAPVELWTCTGGANQQWQPRNGTLFNPVSRKCLDDPRFNTADGTQIEIYTCNGGRNQQWKLPEPCELGRPCSQHTAAGPVARARREGS